MPSPDFQQKTNRELQTDFASGVVQTGAGLVKTAVEKLGVGKPAPKTIGPETVEYPSENLEQWCNIRIQEYVYRAQVETNIKNTLGDIRLPLPLQLQTQYQQQWNNNNGVTGFLGEVGRLGMEGNLGGSLGNLVANALSNPELYAAIGFAGNGPIPGLSVAGVASAATALAGVAANKFETVTYEKPELRQHQFSWNLVARSRDEGVAIQEIIKKLKYHSHPGGGSSGAYFSYPELFNVQFFFDENLFTIGPSILENLSIDYHAAGRPLYQASQFKETAALTKDLIEKQRR
jgi:hypothetical protein